MSLILFTCYLLVSMGLHWLEQVRCLLIDFDFQVLDILLCY